MTTLCQVTMNAGDDILGSVIKWNLLNNHEEFDRVIVVDGNLTPSARSFYNKFHNVEVVDSPWKDSYVDQYKAWFSRLEEEEWALYLDCDEIPSRKLLDVLKSPTLKESGANIYKIPCVLHMTENYQKYYPVEPWPEKKLTDQWTKNILLKKTESVGFRYFGSHVIPEDSLNQYGYISLPYFHMKSFESFILNDVWQAFLSPEGQQYSATDAAYFKLFTKQYKTTAEFKKATKDGLWPEPLKKFAWDRRKVYNNPVSRLAWTYFLIYNNFLDFGNLDITLSDVQKFVLDEEKSAKYACELEKNNYIST